MRRVVAGDIARPFRDEVQRGVQAAPATQVPKLVGFLANSDPAARKYAEWTMRACSEDLIDYELREVDAMNVEEELYRANADPAVHGIMMCVSRVRRVARPRPTAAAA